MQDDPLLTQLRDDLEQANRLIELTEQEFQALSERKLPELEQLLAAKQPILAVLAQHASQRSQLLASRKLPPSREGLVSLVANHPLSGEILASADALGQCLEHCQALNQRNGRLIRNSQTAIGSMLGILRGRSDTPDLYDSRGGTRKGSSNRPFSQA